MALGKKKKLEILEMKSFYTCVRWKRRCVDECVYSHWEQLQCIKDDIRKLKCHGYFAFIAAYMIEI